ncbi:TRAP transporter substrate-binding protein [Desulfosarcina ovata]|uniref:TRAP transporter substrate-binding protein n=1 Tax=Desulfosarcina ovata TaxID=83564 RepID=UPI001E4CEA4D|nr:TRAP transporter substrate-binding protein [Desulfosarcina ovata]
MNELLVQSQIDIKKGEIMERSSVNLGRSMVWVVAIVFFLFGSLLMSCGQKEDVAESKKEAKVEEATKAKTPKKKGLSLDAWKANFDPSGAKYKCIVSNVSHPVIKGVYAGFAMRDELWKRTNGQIYIDFKPFSMLGGEVEVLNQLQMGAIQGMGVSSVAATNLGPRFGLINLPFLINSFEKLEKFVGSGKLFDHYMMAMDHQGIMGLDITGYGNYGWATTTPVKTIADAKKVKFRIAEAAVNKLNYEKWGFNPVVMPWPDVPVALKQGVIDGLDHTPMVCNITKKFDVAKYFTQLNYAQGLFIWIFNKAWFNNLPSDLQKTFIETVHDVCADIRKQTIQQEIDQIAAAKENGIEFFKLSDSEMDIVREQGNATHEKFADEINQLYPGDTYRPENYLKEVQNFMGYTK